MQYNDEVQKIINNLKEHCQKKQDIIDKGQPDEKVHWEAVGRVNALSHAIQELEFLYQTGKSKD
ncbi:hypothetical protein SAMN04487969_11950 [Paenibacillus algorifonticola]|uniref:Uncharacterized protein n=1 Tax=Paenibacillus algorifonticola TaxID=684063 RepID=A0A1I2GZK5_9BACL|nr:hypothetical protein [Paenibacillus algorifonticola]SFF22842.1 hypothetical protein SAMN04487969_11950 [Paenibacillus algorifonticola]